MEVKDKEVREQNIIIYRLKESEETNVEARKKYDDNLIQRLHNEVLELNNLKVKNITRLGRKQDGKDRPTKVTLESTEDKTRIMQRLHKLHDADETYRNISVSHDLTRDERNEVRKLVEEAKEKNEKEGGLYVHKVRGPPWNLRIVRMKRRE